MVPRQILATSLIFINICATMKFDYATIFPIYDWQSDVPSFVIYFVQFSSNVYIYFKHGARYRCCCILHLGRFYLLFKKKNLSHFLTVCCRGHTVSLLWPIEESQL